MRLTKQHFAEVAARVAADELTPGEAYRLLGRIQLDQDNARRFTAEDRLEAVRLYCDEGMSTAKIAERLLCSEGTIRHHLKAAGIELRSCSEAARPRSKVTDDEVREIRASSDTNPVLARRYGVSVSLISAIRNRTTRAHVADVVLPEGLEGTRQALNLLPTHNAALADHLARAARHAESTRHLLKAVANTSESPC